ncbi:CbtB domain-containing protein [Marinicellulosiphila megalodicopiae]|uniref:CbtB domain-containing protein n=1 Tax=Marinicellulosiphila megalodicopiae TaxID=2724896 RepID=UPI003BAF5B22
MNFLNITSSITLSKQSVLMASMLFTSVLAIALVYTVGFAPMDLLHNAAHDTRHIAAFPCH